MTVDKGFCTCGRKFTLFPRQASGECCVCDPVGGMRKSVMGAVTSESSVERPSAQAAPKVPGKKKVSKKKAFKRRK